MLLKLELSHQKILFGCLFAENISSCTQHSRRAAPLDPSPVMQSCAARLNARLTKQSVNCELLCIIALSTYYQSPSGPVSNSLPLKLFQLNDSNAIFIDHNCNGSHARTSHSRTGNFASRSFMRCDAQSI